MNRLLTIIMLLFCAVVLVAQSDTDSLQTLTGAASQTSPNEYTSTLSRLEKLSAAGVRNADMYYDLGVCNYHLGERGLAVLNFLRALNIDSAHKHARENLVYIHAVSPDLPQAPEQPYLLQLFLRIYDFFSLNRLALSVLVFALLTALSLHLFFHYPPDKEHGLPILAVLICGILLLGFGSALLVKNHRYLNNNKAVVLSLADPFRACLGEGVERTCPGNYGNG